MHDRQVSSQASRPRHLLWFWTAVGIVSAVAIFVLPLRFPPQAPSFSPSYEVGFNNHVAAVATAFISFSVALILFWLRVGPSVPPRTKRTARLPRWWLGAASLAAIFFTAVLGGIVVHGDVPFGDADYFVTQLSHALYDPNAVLFRDIEFPYGYLLFYWPLLFIKVLGHAGLSPAAAYMVSLAAMHVLGLALLFYILGRLPLSRVAQGVAMATLTLGSLSPILGLNYTLFRFTLPYAAILWIARRKGLPRQALLFAAGEIGMLLVSAELGIAFAVGTALYAAYLAVTSSPRWLAVALAPPLALALFAASVGRSYFHAIATFGDGSFNSVVDPSRIHIDILILAAVAVCPYAMAGLARSTPAEAPAVIGMYGAALAMLPSALGRCDALHTFFNGIGIALLALVAIRSLGGLWPKVWVALFILSASWSQATQAGRLIPQLAAMVRNPGSTGGFNVASLEKIARGERISAPLDLPLPVRRQLMRDRQYEPTYYCRMPPNRSDETMRIAEMRRAPFTLLPAGDYTMRPDIIGGASQSWLNYGHRYTLIHAEYIAGALMEQEVRQHWAPVSTFGSYILYRRTD